MDSAVLDWGVGLLWVGFLLLCLLQVVLLFFLLEVVCCLILLSLTGLWLWLPSVVVLFVGPSIVQVLVDVVVT